jgi:hypothetical protein
MRCLCVRSGVDCLCILNFASLAGRLPSTAARSISARYQGQLWIPSISLLHTSTGPSIASARAGHVPSPWLSLPVVQKSDSFKTREPPFKMKTNRIRVLTHIRVLVGAAASSRFSVWVLQNRQRVATRCEVFARLFDVFPVRSASSALHTFRPAFDAVFFSSDR